MKFLSRIAFFIITIGLFSSCDEEYTYEVPNDSEAELTFLYNSTKSLKDAATYPIGSATKVDRLNDNNYIGTLNQEFNSVTAENKMKMREIYKSQTTYDFSAGDALIAHAKENGMRVHGHALVWHSSIPDWLNNYSGTDEQFADLIKDYITTTVQHFAAEKDANGESILASWDVINEAWIVDNGTAQLRNTIFRQRMGDNYIAKLYQWAREADPDVILFYNDYNLVDNPIKRQATIDMANDFIANNIPIDGIGLQMHISVGTSANNFPRAFESVAATGLLVHLSELDIKVGGDDFTEEGAYLQERQYQRVGYYYHNLIPEAQQFGITLWGFRDQDSWLYTATERPLIFDVNYDTKVAHRGLVAGLEGNPVF